MTRRLGGEDARLWSVVTATVRPFPGRKAPVAMKAAQAPDRKAPAVQVPVTTSPPRPALLKRPGPPQPIEPRRRRNLARGRNPLEATLDLHGHGEFAAEDVMRAFLIGAQQRGLRAVLVITGRGVAGTGIIRRRAPEWLAAPVLRDVVAGFSESHQRHGGEGALYVAIKRRPGP